MNLLSSCALMLWSKVSLFVGIVWRKWYDYRLTPKDAFEIILIGWAFPPKPGTYGRKMK